MISTNPVQPNLIKNEPLSGIPVYYHRCPSCDFIFTTHCDNWTPEEFRRNIYNDRYIECDPFFVESRPMGIAKWFETWFSPSEKLKILDFGSGGGMFGAYLNNQGFDVVSYDPFLQRQCSPPSLGGFDLVVAAEVVEHSHTPLQTFKECMSFLKKDQPTLFVFTTMMTPVIPEELKHNLGAYWYAGPRNGHVSLFSEKTIKLIAEKNDAFYVAGSAVGEHASLGFFFFRRF